MTADQGQRADELPKLSALDMARNLVDTIERLSRFLDGGPEAEIQAHINGYGARQAHAATMAAQLALVSIAEDVHRVVGVMLDGDVPPRFQEPDEPGRGRM
jgi:hypothetical protein